MPFGSILGNTKRSSGDIRRQTAEVSPERSAIFISPLQRHIVPVRRMQSETASPALCIIAEVSSPMPPCTAAETTEKSIIPTQKYMIILIPPNGNKI